jgi:hypothetical protein
LGFVVVVVLLFASSAWADSGRLFLNKIKFEPRNEQRPIEIKPGASIDAKGADSAADALRRQLISEGFRDAQVEASLVPAGRVRTVDMRVHVSRGPRYSVDEVEFIGDPKLEIKKLKRAFRRLPYSDPAVESAISHTRSLYVSHGYFDAEVRVDHVKQKGEKVTLVIEANAGKQYRMEDGSEFSARELCACLYGFRRASEKAGAIDFIARLDIDGSPEDDFVTVRPISLQGAPFTVGRIEFRGNHSFGDLTLRRALKLDEGALFDGERFRQSVGQLNSLKLFEPLSQDDVEIRRDNDGRVADIAFRMKEKPRGRWSLSGPVIPVGVAGPFTGSITSRLPGWGRGMLELSTYYFSFSMMGLPSISRFLPVSNSVGRWLPLVAIARPALPGQRWLSGFTVSPQLGLQSMLAGYAMSQAHVTVRGLLRSGGIETPPIVVPVQWISPARPAKAGALLCEPPKSRWATLRRIGSAANEMVLGAGPFF